MNKSGNRRGEADNNKQNFKNDKTLASKAGRKPKTKQAAIQAITKSSAISENVKKEGKGHVKRITPEIQNEIREKLTAPDEKGHTYINDFIDNFLKEAKKDPNSRSGMLLASALFSEKLLATLDEEVNKQMNRDISFADYNIRKTLYDKQQEVYDNNQDKVIVVINSRRTGKCWAPGTLIRLFDGTVKKVEDIREGDILMGYDNSPRKVLSTTHGTDTMYRVHSSRDDVSFVCNSAHILTVWDRNTNTLVDKPLSYFLKHPSTASGYSGHYRLIRAKIDYPETKHVIDPYILGLWLGDGCKNDAQIAIGKDEKELIEFAQESGWNVYYGNNAAPSWWVPGIKPELRRLNLLGNKHIPQEYKIDSIENRFKLLAGLIDSDGWHDCPGSTNICLSDKVLFDDVLELIHSLGLHTMVRGPISTSYKKNGIRVECKEAYSVTFKGDLDLIPNKVSRKQGSKSKQNLGYGFAIDILPEGDYYGFTVEGDGRVLLSDYTVNHNTELAGRLLAKRILRPDQHVVYINRSFDAAVRQVQRPTETALSAASVHYEGTINGGRLDFDNGSWLLIIGNNNAADVNKLRGEKIALVIIDECGHQRHLRELIQEVIQPATIDYADSQIIFTGTPPRTKTSFIHELWHNPKVKKYHWTFMDNPFLPNRDKVIEEACNMYGVSPDSNFIRREFFGDMEAYDLEAIYIKHFEKKEAPKEILYSHAYVCVDFGYDDKAAVVGMLADKNTKTLYIVKDWSEAKKGIVEISQKVVEMVDYLKKNYKIDREIRVITDTNEKSASQDLYTTYHIPNVCLAYKYDKDYALDQLADWWHAGTIVVSENAKATIEDAENMIWKRDEDTDKIIHELDDEAYHGNAMFAILYGSRQFAYDVMGLVAENKPAKEITNSQEMVEQYEDFSQREEIGLLDIGTGEMGRHFVR